MGRNNKKDNHNQEGSTKETVDRVMPPKSNTQKQTSEVRGGKTMDASNSKLISEQGRISSHSCNSFSRQ